MPKLKKKFADTKTAPPIDWMWAAVLERQRVYGMDIETIAKKVGVSYGMMRKYMGQSPWCWPPQVRRNVCDLFGIEIDINPSAFKARGSAEWTGENTRLRL